MMVDRGELQAWKTSGGHRRISRTSVNLWRAGKEVVVKISDRMRAAPKTALPLPSSAIASHAHRVLLIEDSVYYQKLVRLVIELKFPQLVLSVADDGLAGLAMYGQVEPDALIVDILLPGVDGATLITTLRSHPQFARSQLLVITSLDVDQRAPYEFALQDVTVIHKSDLVSELPLALDRALQQFDAEMVAPDPRSGGSD